MIDFRYHDGCEKEIAVLEKRRLRFVRESLSGFQNVCEIHFHPTTPQARIHPGKLHRITQNDSWTLWKTELPIMKSGLTPNKYPRIWFAVSGNIIVFLCIASHVDNYSDEDMNQVAISRVSDFF